MAQESLITALDEDARAQAARILDEAREAAEASLKEASIEADREKQERTRALETRLRGERAALLNGARSRASGARLAVRHELARRAVKEALERVLALPGPEYASLVAALFAEIERHWEKERPGEAPVVIVNPADARLLKTGLDVKEDAAVRGGVVFASEDGFVRFENTAGSRVEKAMATMAPAIDEMLFGEVLD